MMIIEMEQQEEQSQIMENLGHQKNIMNIELTSDGEYSPVSNQYVVPKRRNMQGNAQGQSPPLNSEEPDSHLELKDQIYEQIQEINDFDGSIAIE